MTPRLCGPTRWLKPHCRASTREPQKPGDARGSSFQQPLPLSGNLLALNVGGDQAAILIEAVQVGGAARGEGGEFGAAEEGGRGVGGCTDRMGEAAGRVLPEIGDCGVEREDAACERFFAFDEVTGQQGSTGPDGDREATQAVASVGRAGG